MRPNIPGMHREGTVRAVVEHAPPCISWRRWALQFGLSVAVVLLCLRLVSWQDVRALLAASDPGVLLLGALCLLAANAVSAWKASAVLDGRGGSPGFLFCFRAYMGGFFFNQFLPMGCGDLHRVATLGRATGRWLAVGSALFWERWSGLQALVLVCAAALVLSPPPLGTPATRAFGLACIVGIALLTLFLMFMPGARYLPARLESALREARPSTPLLMRLFLASLVQPLLTAAFYAATFAAAGWRMEGLASVVVSGYVTVLIQVPLFVNGLGIQEAGLLALGAVPPAVALSASVLAHVGRSLVGLVGGLALLGGGIPRVPTEP